ncbi:MAG: hypothetical protein KatS3mg110_1161 [Pirellulaceae bacterium]|nr:MAG: hypothetical protein KatS3mg110_1161 [Pirellulaceae bacterium]
MIPFTLRCTTCRRQLVVRHAAAVGKILPCPSCGSMVLVEAPPGHPLAGGTAGQPSPSGSPARNPVDSLSRPPLEAVPVEQADTVDDPLYASGATASRRAEENAATPPVVSPSIEQTDLQATPPQLWLSYQSRLIRRWLITGLAGVALAVLVIVLATLWLGGSKPVAMRGTGLQDTRLEKSSEPAEPGSEVPHGSSEPAAPPENSGPGATRPIPPDQHPAVGQSEPSIGDNSPEQPMGNRPEASGTEREAPREKPPIDKAAIGGPPAGQEARPPAPAGGPAMPVDPVARPALSVEQALRDLEALTADIPLGRTAPSGPSLYDLFPSPGRAFDASQALPKPPARRSPNAANQLAVKIPSLDFHQVPLADWCRWIQDVTTIPVTLDVDALHRAGLSADVPVDVTLNNEDFTVALQRSLEPRGLIFRVADNQVLVSVADSDKVETVQYEVFDLVGDDPERNAQLASWLVELVAPVAWKQYGGPGQLQLVGGRLEVTTTRTVQYEVRMFCERLRVARGARPQGTVPLYVAQLRPRIDMAIDRLAQSITVHRPVGVPLLQILDEIAEASDLVLVVDWNGLIGEGWTPQSLARLDVEDVSVSEALQQLLGPMQLSFRVIDARTLQITTMPRAWNLEEIAFFPLDAVWGKDEGRTVLERVRTVLGHAEAPGVARGRFLVDPVSRTLMLVAPQYRIAQVAGLLERLANRTEEPQPPLPPVE